ncbi:hypothetical protein JIN85_03995 [Luteolibacter pohnpeiensis]|uniref:Uncharacterized protein n=1 Tax=Luteolibacter pohnpeiensis TaxID=454153 RepID=A0A934S445_9BACT|nr:hypothetical protein [Luteolibacter pohnpeiensis]MBK1881563.1 hypothetical protein [Luteolibacter pohnpeiensis]
MSDPFVICESGRRIDSSLVQARALPLLGLRKVPEMAEARRNKTQSLKPKHFLCNGPFSRSHSKRTLFVAAPGFCQLQPCQVEQSNRFFPALNHHFNTGHITEEPIGIALSGDFLDNFRSKPGDSLLNVADESTFTETPALMFV